MMNYKMETVVEAKCGIRRSVRSYKTLESAKKKMAEWVKKLDSRKADGNLYAYRVTVIYENRELYKAEA